MFHYSRFHACSFVQQAGLLCKTSAVCKHRQGSCHCCLQYIGAR